MNSKVENISYTNIKHHYIGYMKENKIKDYPWCADVPLFGFVHFDALYSLPINNSKYFSKQDESDLAKHALFLYKRILIFVQWIMSTSFCYKCNID